MAESSLKYCTGDLVSLVKSNYRFSYVEEEDLYKLLSLVSYMDFPRSSFIYMEGDTIGSMYIVVSGRAEISMSNHRFSEKIFSIIGPGQMLGLSEVFNCHGIHTTSAFCETDTTVAAISKEDFRKAVFELPSFSFAVSIYMANMIGELRHELAMSGAEVRILMYLKGLLIKAGYTGLPGEQRVIREVTTDKLAKILNITRETASRTLSGLKERNIVTVEKDYFIIHDPEHVINAVPEYSCLPDYHR